MDRLSQWRGYGGGMNEVAGDAGVLHYLVDAITAGLELVKGEFIVGDPEDNERRADPDRQSEDIDDGEGLIPEEDPKGSSQVIF